MVKGISRQVIVLQSPDPELFDQAIFILKDTAVNNGFTEEKLLKEAKKLVKENRSECTKCRKGTELVWAGLGAAITGSVWLLFALL